MPITVTAPRGVLTPAGEREILPRLTHALLEASEAVGNPFFTSIIGGSVHLLDPRDLYAGGKQHPLVMVELKLPDVGLDTPESRAAFITLATRIVAELTGPEHDDRTTWINILNAPSCGWGIGGLAYTGDKLIATATASHSRRRTGPCDAGETGRGWAGLGLTGVLRASREAMITGVECPSCRYRRAGAG